ncbi:protein of unknown function [Mariniphaga anaerophila]|uniref:3-keto-alpha-glucoside-1,2-lyase/3-keto-2-hydroxy-glucal hydratase domain-containing protein n=1 Tax=Mariniphaga anaerophila TaxID=1484053 RepID=A0A1M5BD79_9BACT|nr:DUF1080 domain-containing protein [Mariniphaga anaerophila]SHF40511.1 protein of unknown function [Mariniphaga anaerophila]
MKHLIYFVMSALLLTVAGCTPKEPEINTLTKKEIAEGWELLFDGKSLSNWKTFNGGEVTGWKIVDGILHNSGVGADHGGDIITKKEFQNFELYVEWKIAAESNSGIFYHCQEGVVNAIYESAPEYQLIDDKGWPTKLKDSQYSGSNYDMNAPVNAEVVPIDEWNKTRILVDGPHVEHWLNGKKVVEYELWSDDWKARKEESKWRDKPYYGMSKSGHIGLQDHGGLTMFRNMKIREIK